MGASSRQLLANRSAADTEHVGNIGDRHVVPVGQVNDSALLNTEPIKALLDGRIIQLHLHVVLRTSADLLCDAFEPRLTSARGPVMFLGHVGNHTKEKALRVPRRTPRAIMAGDQVSECVGNHVSGVCRSDQKRRIPNQVGRPLLIRRLEGHLVHTDTLPHPSTPGDAPQKKPVPGPVSVSMPSSRLPRVAQRRRRKPLTRCQSAKAKLTYGSSSGGCVSASTPRTAHERHAGAWPTAQATGWRARKLDI